MKRLLTILTITISLSARATDWMTYYVYFETDYIQGPWTRTDILEKSNYKYLAPQVFEDLFGSEDADLVNKMLSRLKEKKPEIYDWTYDLTFQGDTVILSIKGQIEDLETVKNEITATLTLNNFKAVIFHLTDNQDTLTIADLTLPYLDLVSGKPNTNNSKEKQENRAPIKNDIIHPHEAPEKEGNQLSFWLIISVFLNIGLIGLIIMKKKKIKHKAQ